MNYPCPALWFNKIDSPALFVYPEIIRKNISTAIALTGDEKGKFLRPHIKTVKCKEVVQMAMDLGIDKFKCSTISEAELLGQIYARDVLLSYQLSSVKAQRFKNLIEKYPNTNYSCLIDNEKSAWQLIDTFKGEPISVYVDINLGMNRSGLVPADVAEFLGQLQKKSELKVVGLHGYEGHINSSNVETRRIEAEQAYQTMVKLKSKAQMILNRELNLVLGGSPTFEFYACKKNIECSPGTFFLWDYGYKYSYPEIPFEVAAMLLTRVVSIINNKELCLDLGYKAVASDQELPRVIFPYVDQYTVLGQYEEHMVVSVPDTAVYQVGSAWYAIPYHICPTVNLYEKTIPVEDGRRSVSWEIVARNRKLTV